MKKKGRKTYGLLEDTLQKSNKNLVRVWECFLDNERFLLDDKSDFVDQ